VTVTDAILVFTSSMSLNGMIAFTTLEVDNSIIAFRYHVDYAENVGIKGEEVRREIEPSLVGNHGTFAL